MIAPSYSITATERVLPRLALDFTTASLDPRVTFTRSGNTATVINSSGVIVGVNADIPRFDFDPVTLVCRGLLIEESRTNALLNSLIDGTSLATQSVTVTAVARTLSFYGTGNIVLSGAHSATVTGTGAYPTRTTLTFTPTAGALTLTVTGTVQFAQLEAGAFATSFIPTVGAAVTRNADAATMTGTNFSDWFNASEGAFSVSATPMQVVSSVPQRVITVVEAGNSYLQIGQGVGGTPQTNCAIYLRVAGADSFFMYTGTIAANTDYKAAFSYKANDFGGSVNASNTTTDLSGSVLSTPTLMRIGANETGAVVSNLWIKNIMYWPQRITNNEVQAFSK